MITFEEMIDPNEKMQMLVNNRAALVIAGYNNELNYNAALLVGDEQEAAQFYKDMERNLASIQVIDQKMAEMPAPEDQVQI